MGGACTEQQLASLLRLQCLKRDATYGIDPYDVSMDSQNYICFGRIDTMVIDLPTPKVQLSTHYDSIRSAVTASYLQAFAGGLICF